MFQEDPIFKIKNKTILYIHAHKEPKPMASSFLPYLPSGVNFINKKTQKYFLIKKPQQ